MKNLESSLNEKEIFLLHYLHHRKIAWKIDQPVKDLFSDYREAISKLKKSGYLSEDNHSAFLDEMSISDLKNILKSISLPVSGKKAELIERIIKHTTPEQRANICPDLYYALSPAGKAVDESYKASKKALQNNLKEKVFSEIKSQSYEQAALAKAAVYSKETMPPGIGVDWSDTENIRENSQKEQNLIREYDFSDLSNSNDYKELLFQTLYYDNEIEHNLISSIKKFVMPCAEKIICPDIENFFQNKGYSPNEEEKVYTYLLTKRFNAFQLNMQKTLKSSKYRPLPKGDFYLSNQTISLWKKLKEDREEFANLSKLEIDGFPKTLRTFQIHKDKNDDKYKLWISYKDNR